MKRALASILCLALFLSGCGKQTVTDESAAETASVTASDPVTGTIFAMDTVMDLTIYGDEALLTDAETRVMQLESLFSVTDSDSEIYAVNHSGSAELSADTSALLNRALELCGMTDGALDISIYPVVRAWGFTTGDYGIPEDETLQELLSNVDYTKIDFDNSASTVTIPSDMEIDLGSVAKGYTGDELVSLLRNGGVTSALLNLGGNVQALGAKPDGSPWRVAVQDPSGDDYIGVVEITDQAVITSGGYERYFEEDGITYWHIIDPATGYPARNGLISVTIIGDSGVMCDALSTALFVMGLDKATEFWRENGGFEAVFVTDDGQIAITEGLQETFTLLADTSQELMVIRQEG